MRISRLSAGPSWARPSRPARLMSNDLQRPGPLVADTTLAREGERTARPPPRPWRAELSAIAVIAHRDFVKLLRDRLRLFSELAFPLVLVLILGPALQSGFGSP